LNFYTFALLPPALLEASAYSRLRLRRRRGDCTICGWMGMAG